MTSTPFNGGSPARRIFSLLALLPLFALTLPGAAAADQATAVPTDQSEAVQALASLQELLRAYSEGQVENAQALVAPQMTGYSRVMVAMRDAGFAKKQFLISLSDTSTFASADVVIVRTGWEKRFLTLPALAPRRISGHSTFVMRRQEGVWRLFATGGDNLFTAR